MELIENYIEQLLGSIDVLYVLLFVNPSSYNSECLMYTDIVL